MSRGASNYFQLFFEGLPTPRDLWYILMVQGTTSTRGDLTGMRFTRRAVPCLWTGCPNTTRRVMEHPPTRTTIMLCEFHLKKLMAGLKESA